jgi:hypothetical protein
VETKPRPTAPGKHYVAPPRQSKGMRHSLAAAYGALHAVVGILLLGTGGDATNIPDAPRHVRSLATESALAIPLLLVGLAASGALALVASMQGRPLRALALGAGGAVVASFAAFLLANDFGAPLLVLGLTLVWSWMAILAAGTLPLAAAHALRSTRR